ncbi:MAG: hypothetical protein ACYC0X_18985 [Pirellulaceae bacterium]
MKPTHLLAGLLVIAALLADRVVAAHLQTAPDMALLLLWGGACGQLALLGMWSVLATTAWLFRLLGVLAGAAYLAAPLSAATSGQWSEWFLVLCMFAGVVGLAVAGARWWGFAVRVTVAGDELQHPLARLGRTQYSLGGLLSLLTAVGLLCGLRDEVAFPWRHAVALASYGTCLTWVALSSVWAMASSRAVALRLIVLTLSCLGAGLVMSSTELVRNIWFFTMVAFLESAVICLGINVLLTGGLYFDAPRGDP